MRWLEDPDVNSSLLPVRRVDTFRERRPEEGGNGPERIIRLQDRDGNFFTSDIPGPWADWIVETLNQQATELNPPPTGEPGKRIGSFRIPFQPITKKNSQQLFVKPDGSPGSAPSRQYRQYLKDAGALGQTLWVVKPRRLPIDYPVAVAARFHMQTRGIVDLSNLIAGLHDLMVDLGMIMDDSWKYIVSVDGSRVMFDKDRPRTEVVISEWLPGKKQGELK
jgi:hypothetical protein